MTELPSPIRNCYILFTPSYMFFNGIFNYISIILILESHISRIYIYLSNKNSLMYVKLHLYINILFKIQIYL